MHLKKGESVAIMSRNSIKIETHPSICFTNFKFSLKLSGSTDSSGLKGNKPELSNIDLARRLNKEKLKVDFKKYLASTVAAGALLAFADNSSRLCSLHCGILWGDLDTRVQRAARRTARVQNQQ